MGDMLTTTKGAPGPTTLNRRLVAGDARHVNRTPTMDSMFGWAVVLRDKGPRASKMTARDPEIDSARVVTL